MDIYGIEKYTGCNNEKEELRLNAPSYKGFGGEESLEIKMSSVKF